MTVQNMKDLVGKEGMFATNEGLDVRVKILDVKMAYGYILYCITPVAGGGKRWVRSDRVTISRA